jgi:hypothetical protein
MKKVFVLQHLHFLPAGGEDVKFIGVYSSSASAHAAVARLAQQPGFREHPNIADPSIDSGEQGFYISEATLDADQWIEGYATV